MNTSAIIERVLNENKLCFVPRFKPKGADMEMVRLNSLEEYRNLPTIMWGIRQPPVEQELESAFDSGERRPIVPPPSSSTCFDINF